MSKKSITLSLDPTPVFAPQNRTTSSLSLSSGLSQILDQTQDIPSDDICSDDLKQFVSAVKQEQAFYNKLGMKFFDEILIP